jgi:DNA-binding NtrC family response regulator
LTARRDVLAAVVARLADECAALEAQQAAFTEAARGLVMAVTGAAPAPSGPIDGTNLPGLLLRYERALVSWALARSGGQQVEAAALLGIPPTTLHEKLKRLGLSRHRPPAGTAALNSSNQSGTTTRRGGSASWSSSTMRKRPSDETS